MDNSIALMRQPITQDLPGGVLGTDIEIFTTGDKVFAIINGCTVEFSLWPESLVNLLHEDLAVNPKAIQALISLGIDAEAEMLWQYARCRFGSFDGRPDLQDGKFLYTEYWNCGIRGNCPVEGKLCCSMKMPGGIITPREIQVWRLIGKGFLDKEIADKLGISVLTVPQYVRSLCSKCQVRNRADLVRLAVKYNIS